MTGALNMGGQKITNVLFTERAAAANVASASTVDVGAQAGRSFAVTGTTTITSFGVANNGVLKSVRFAGILTLTHSSNLRLPGSANVTTADGDALHPLPWQSSVEVIAYFKRSIIPGDASTLNSQAASYYTELTARLGYTPANKAGDTFTGAVTLAGAPTVDLHASTKKYVDDQDAAHVHAWSVITNRNLEEGANTQDPDSSVYPHFLSNHANTPDSGYYWHITQQFYSSVASNANRSQVAVCYTGDRRMYFRASYSGAWSAWTRCDNLEAETQGLGTNGYQKLPGGLIMQWGEVLRNATDMAVTFPVTFSTAVRNIQLTDQHTTALNDSSRVVSSQHHNERIHCPAGRCDEFLYVLAGIGILIRRKMSPLKKLLPEGEAWTERWWGVIQASILGLVAYLSLQAVGTHSLSCPDGNRASLYQCATGEN